MSKGRFGVHGGQYIPETLMNAVIGVGGSVSITIKVDPAVSGGTVGTC